MPLTSSTEDSDVIDVDSALQATRHASCLTRSRRIVDEDAGRIAAVHGRRVVVEGTVGCGRPFVQLGIERRGEVVELHALHTGCSEEEAIEPTAADMEAIEEIPIDDDGWLKGIDLPGRLTADTDGVYYGLGLAA